MFETVGISLFLIKELAILGTQMKKRKMKLFFVNLTLNIYISFTKETNTQVMKFCLQN